MDAAEASSHTRHDTLRYAKDRSQLFAVLAGLLEPALQPLQV